MPIVPKAKVEIVTVREGEEFDLDFTHEVLEISKTQAADDEHGQVRSYRVVILRRGL